MKVSTNCLPDSTSSAARAFKLLPLRAPRIAEVLRLRAAVRCAAGSPALRVALSVVHLYWTVWWRTDSVIVFEALSNGQAELTSGVIGARVVA